MAASLTTGLQVANEEACRLLQAVTGILEAAGQGGRKAAEERPPAWRAAASRYNKAAIVVSAVEIAVPKELAAKAIAVPIRESSSAYSAAAAPASSPR